MLDCVGEQRALEREDHRDVAEARLPLGARDVDGVEPLADVLPSGLLDLAPASRRGDDEGHAGGPVGGQLGEEVGELLAREGALPRLVVGREGDGEDLVDPAAPEPRADGEPQRITEDDQLLRDGVIRDLLGPALRDVCIDVTRPESAGGR